MKKLILAVLAVLFCAPSAMAAQQTIEGGTGILWGTTKTKINENFTELYTADGTQDTAIGLNTAKVTNTDTQDLGITGNNVTLVNGGTADVSSTTAVTANTAKVSFDSTTSARLINTTGTNTGDQAATGVAVTASGFDGNLATTDDTVQEVAQKFDDLVISGGSALTTIDETTTLSTATTQYTFAGSGVTATEPGADGLIVVTVAGGAAPVDSVNGETGTVVLGAADIDIADAGGLITATEVEAALQENRTAINAKQPLDSTLTTYAGLTGPSANVQAILQGADYAAVRTLLNVADGAEANVYPGAGIPLSTGSAWGTSYSLTTLMQALDDLTWVFANGITVPSITSSAADGTHYSDVINTVTLTSTATLGRFAFLADRFWIANGTNWTTRYFFDSSMTIPETNIHEDIARDSEVTADIATHAGSADPHTGYRLESVDIDSGDIASGAIDTAHIAASQITNALMADNAVDTAELADDAVGTDELSNALNIVTTGTIQGRLVEVVKTSDATLTLEEIRSTFITNYGDNDNADLILTAPNIDTSIGNSFIYTIVTAMSTNDTCFKASADNLINFEGTAGADNGCVCNAAPALGDELACYNVTIGASVSNWFCKGLLGTWAAVADNTGDCPN